MYQILYFPNLTLLHRLQSELRVVLVLWSVGPN